MATTEHPEISPDVDLSVVVPSYQAGERLAPFLDRLALVLDGMQAVWEVVVVDDGSTDGSTDAVSARGVRVVHHVSNRGKGAAVRTGFGVVTGRLVAVIDADGQYDPRSLVPLVALCDAGWDVAVGQRFDAAAATTYSRARTSASGLMLRVVRLVVDGALSETQAGIKVFRSEVVSAVAEHLECDGFAIDVEVLAWARRLGFRRQAVHPVSFEHDGRTTVTVARSVAMLRDLIRIRRRLARSGVVMTDRRTRRSSGRDRRALELWAHAARLCATESRSLRPVEEIVSRAGGDGPLIRHAAALALDADRRSTERNREVVELLNEAAGVVERRTDVRRRRPERRFAEERPMASTSG